MGNQRSQRLIKTGSSEVESEVADGWDIETAVLISDDTVGNTITIVVDGGTTTLLGDSSEVVRG